MKIVVIPDVHLKTCLFDYAEDILKSGKAERAVCLMDIPDDWGKQYRTDLYEEIYDRAIAFAKAFPDTLWCYGNHDISYLWGEMESGFSILAEGLVITKLKELEKSLKDRKQLTFIHRVDNVLFMHGGLTEEFLKCFNKELLAADIDDVISAVNAAPRKSLWAEESPIWFRPQLSKRTIFRNDLYKQVVGHTPVDEINEKDGVISTDVFSTFPDGEQIGESAMIVIDTVSGGYEKVNVASSVLP